MTSAKKHIGSGSRQRIARTLPENCTFSRRDCDTNTERWVSARPQRKSVANMLYEMIGVVCTYPQRSLRRNAN